MARAVPGANQYMALQMLLEMDIERLDKTGLRFYLEQRLRHLESRIHALSATYGAMTRSDLQRWLWTRTPIADAMWEDLFELDYLEAMRQAMFEALAEL
jgi:hypothetical protein